MQHEGGRIVKTCLCVQTDLFNWNDYYWAANVLLAEVTDGGTFHQQARPASPSVQADIAMDFPSSHASHQQIVARCCVWQSACSGTAVLTTAPTMC